MAKLKSEQLQAALSRALRPIYVVCGDETLLVHEACAAIRRAAKQQGYSQHEVHHADAGFSWDNLLMSANAMSLFAEKKILELRIKNGKPGDAGGKALRAYCEHIPDDTLLLVVLPKIDKRSENSAWFKALAGSADVVTIWPVGAQQLPRWIEQRLHQAGLSAEPEALALLCAKIEGNLLAAVQEIEKLKLLSDKSLIDTATMAEAVMDSARYSIFDLVDKALGGDAQGCTSCLNGLKAEGNAPPMVLWALANQVRTLAQLKESCDAGRSFEASCKQLRIWQNKQALTRKALERKRAGELQWLLRKCAHADKVIKGLASGDIWSVLLDISLDLCGVQALNKRTQKQLLTI
ncbi:DNA polymerase III subunit delta [Agaribacterium haliotis]|uniref:DNA polymerase III subunit delta n=1 Tax=Agaribacterium haliotis TaxID=2013869 RepID=UPI000BB58BB2|nr:DNA polymerase III subunit delta [Agaribacterium haliotis]